MLGIHLSQSDTDMLGTGIKVLLAVVVCVALFGFAGPLFRNFRGGINVLFSIFAIGCENVERLFTYKSGRGAHAMAAIESPQFGHQMRQGRWATTDTGGWSYVRTR